MDLQDTFYVMGIIYMAIMFILMIAALIAVFAIKKKINAIHDTIEQKIHKVTEIFAAGATVASTAKKVFGKDK